MVFITGNIIISGSINLTNVKSLYYNWVPGTYEAQTVMGTVNPTGFKMPHKWVQGEIHVFSEASAQMAAYVNSGSANYSGSQTGGMVLYATETCTTGSYWVNKFSGVFFLNESMRIDDDRDVITVFPFVAKNVYTYRI